ncbi:hypothetical protein CC1G_07411 [Coprinopsis cinerea okayama7|uniref:Uncharacterized protein n=1 Tax=Coprinopsis cinerea (strain Okayama-7 / 130 / ATCC MYA-4618 / FGSC 9003) TaxID=240176 RepID=A8N6P0_COPC7|nr:hypothetical protein CC1G_07411 [Coprinopsis cinerea okayama7\|eukprot:XP_001830496.1 hypothetical protein CC1G_07411 [Coprinopsis cinerea okayama7\
MMLAARSALRCSTRSLPRSLTARRNGSTSSHSFEEPAGADYTVPESFGTPLWRNVILFGVAAVAFYKYAPAPNDDVYLTRWIAMYTKPREYWMSVNAKHTALSQVDARNTLVVHDAMQPPVRRFRYPQGLGTGSPFLNGVGMTVDMSDITVKTDRDLEFKL